MKGQIMSLIGSYYKLAYAASAKFLLCCVMMVLVSLCPQQVSAADSDVKEQPSVREKDTTSRKDDSPRSASSRQRRGNPASMIRESDKNKDGKISREEMPQRMKRFFDRVDTNSDDVIDDAELKALEKRFKSRQPRQPRPDRGGGDSSGKQKGANSSKSGDDPAAEGKVAPDFELKSLDGETSVKLSTFKGKKPVALIFGSYT